MRSRRAMSRPPRADARSAWSSRPRRGLRLLLPQSRQPPARDVLEALAELLLRLDQRRARLAERVAGPVAAAIPPALPERHGRGAAGIAAAAVAARGGGAMTTRTAHRLAVVATLLVAIASCRKATPAPAYETVPVARRDIVVSATASGVIQPILTLSVKSKASGEIIAMPVQTGDEVKKGQLLAK